MRRRCWQDVWGQVRRKEAEEEEEATALDKQSRRRRKRIERGMKTKSREGNTDTLIQLCHRSKNKEHKSNISIRCFFQIPKSRCERAWGATPYDVLYHRSVILRIRREKWFHRPINTTAVQVILWVHTFLVSLPPSNMPPSTYGAPPSSIFFTPQQFRLLIAKTARRSRGHGVHSVCHGRTQYHALE